MALLTLIKVVVADEMARMIINPSRPEISTEVTMAAMVMARMVLY
jgi:hypothetical protein